MNNYDFWYLASYPKSGNTWCRIFISELIEIIKYRKNTGEIKDTYLNINKDINNGLMPSSKCWIDDQLGIDSNYLKISELDKIRGKIGQSLPVFCNTMRFHKVHDAYISPDSDGAPIVLTENCKGIIYIMRDPADVAISLSNFFSWKFEDSIDFLISKNSFLKSKTQVRQYLGSWQDHVRSWTEQKDLPLIKIRYEDLLLNPLENFTKISSFLNITKDKHLIAQAIENSSFQSLKEREIELGGFIERPFGCKYFFRSGLQGEGIKLLNKEQLKLIKNEFYESLVKHKYIQNYQI